MFEKGHKDKMIKFLIIAYFHVSMFLYMYIYIYAIYVYKYYISIYKVPGLILAASYVQR